MQLLFYSIAFRNLFRHKGKSLIVGGLLFLVAFLLTFGNAAIKGINTSLEQNIIHGFTGNMVIISTNQMDKEVFGFMTGRPMSLIHNYAQISNILSSLPFVEDFLPLGRNVAMLLNPTGLPVFYMIYAVDVDRYERFFQNRLIVVEGRRLLSGERGIMIGNVQRNQTAEVINLWLLPEGGEVITSNMPPKILSNLESLSYASNVVLMGLSEEGGSDIRLNVKGVFRFEKLNNLLGDFIAFVDPLSYVEMFHYVITPENISLTKTEKTILQADNLDTLLEQNLFSQETPVSSSTYDETTLKKSLKRQENYTYNPEAYNAVIIKTRPGTGDAEALKKLNRALIEAKADGKAISWQEATPQFSQFIGIVQGMFSVIMFLLFLVSFIIVMNILSMSVIERTTEIGMMRAIGAQKNFVGRMILFETLTLGLVFGGSGILVGALVSWIFALVKLPAKNEMLQLIFGGEYFIPMVTPLDILGNLLVLFFVLWLASLYPGHLAKKTTPLEAISRE
ncbi:ABC transporter permease [Thermospira aquatica]|uniref:ABC transporter permease n=1 Tax=Thermospira aquatica TaxID=2828656 RepID=A0AAX3BC21_9SPIR|nr:FtsX-like permease family protein [Thermospira aquatica]URA09724.1 ABC transporter permease [Thermospira aquatica]